MDRAVRGPQVYTAHTLAPARRRRGLAVEPMTCPANAFQSGDGLVTWSRARRCRRRGRWSALRRARGTRGLSVFGRPWMLLVEPNRRMPPRARGACVERCNLCKAAPGQKSLRASSRVTSDC